MENIESDDEARRASHNVLERKRRNDLKSSFQVRGREREREGKGGREGERGREGEGGRERGGGRNCLSIWPLFYQDNGHFIWALCLG